MTTLLVLARPTDRELALLDRLPEDVRILAGYSPEAFERAAAEADAILAWRLNADLLSRVLEMAPRVRWVHSSAAGVDRLLTPEVLAHPAVLTNARGAYSATLGEFVLAAMLYFAKDLPQMRRNQAARVWQPFDGDVLAGSTLGIVGYGDIGRAIARLAKPFGMRIVALRRRPDRCAGDELVDQAYSRDSLREMLAECDYVAAAAPLTPETRHLLNAEALAAMKPNAVLVNVGRGAVIDEPALIAALQERRILGAALDVFETEPLPADSPLWGLDNVLLSPHTADHTEGWLARSMELFLENFGRFHRGQPLENVVDKRAGY